MSDFTEVGTQFVNHFYGQFNQPREVSNKNITIL